MLKVIDIFLNRITMYRLVLYYLICLIAVAVVMCYFRILPYSPFDPIISTMIIAVFCGATNTIFAKIYGAPTNTESVYITALILALIISPAKPFGQLTFLGWASIISMASKYIFAVNKKHIFNPAAFAVSLTALAINQSASWWLGNLYMLPFVLFGGLLIVRKIQREDLFVSFFAAAFATVMGFNLLGGHSLVTAAKELLFYTPLFFFACVMLTEPMTTPPTKKLRIIYGALVGFLFAPQIHIGQFYSTPELALLAGNIFAYAVSPKQKLILKLKQKNKIAPDTYEFVFQTDQKMNFAPGQYMEWTLPHEPRDNRGIRRFLTIASSPTEQDLRLGVKFYENPSTFKKSLLAMKKDDAIIASQLAGDFTMPKNAGQKLVFIAGGIGITPFRSMIKYLTDKNDRRSVFLIYSNKNSDDAAYEEIFVAAGQKLGIKIIYNETEKTGRMDAATIMNEIPDYKERMFYISGPRSMVDGFERILKQTGLGKKQIKKDFFPGFA